MSRLPAISGRELIRALETIGFVVARQRGSHCFLKHPDGRATVVPVHGHETLGPGLLRKICRDVGLSREDVIALLAE